MIRDAIDVRFPDSSDERVQAMRLLLADTAEPDPAEPVEDWAVSKQVYAEDLDRHLLT